MHERIESLGGSVQAGPGPNGGFIVAATIPLSPAAPQSGTDTGGSGANRYLAYTRIDGSGAPPKYSTKEIRVSRTGWVDLRSGPSVTIF